MGEMTGQPPSVMGYCPACGTESLYLDGRGAVQCSKGGCPNTFAVAALLREPSTHHELRVPDASGAWTLQHPLMERVTGLDCELVDYLGTHVPPVEPGEYRVFRPAGGEAGWLFIPSDVTILEPGQVDLYADPPLTEEQAKLFHETWRQV